MIKYLINAISKGLAFSKNEAKGSLFLAILVVLVIGLSNYTSSKIKNKTNVTGDSTLLASWVAEVEASYAGKKRPKAKTKSKPTFSLPERVLEKKPKPKAVEAEKTEIVILDLNSANAEELQKVNGIGKVYSESIVKYRERLGGFSSTNQLSEIYGMNDELISKVSEQFAIQSATDRLKINADSVKTLIKHPYISYDLAWVIINYRKQNGDITGFEDLKKIKAINDSLLAKLRPYIE